MEVGVSDENIGISDVFKCNSFFVAIWLSHSVTILTQALLKFNCVLDTEHMLFCILWHLCVYLNLRGKWGNTATFQFGKAKLTDETTFIVFMISLPVPISMVDQ